MANVNNQGLQQQSVRDETGTTLSYEGDWMKLFADSGITNPTWNGALLEWINLKLSPVTPIGNLPQAMQLFAEDQGALTWNQMGTFDAS